MSSTVRLGGLPATASTHCVSASLVLADILGFTVHRPNFPKAASLYDHTLGQAYPWIRFELSHLKGSQVSGLILFIRKVFPFLWSYRGPDFESLWWESTIEKQYTSINSFASLESGLLGFQIYWCDKDVFWKGWKEASSPHQRTLLMDFEDMMKGAPRVWGRICTIHLRSSVLAKAVSPSSWQTTEVLGIF